MLNMFCCGNVTGDDASTIEVYFRQTTAKVEKWAVKRRKDVEDNEAKCQTLETRRQHVEKETNVVLMRRDELTQQLGEVQANLKEIENTLAQLHSEEKEIRTQQEKIKAANQSLKESEEAVKEHLVGIQKITAL